MSEVKETIKTNNYVAGLYTLIHHLEETEEVANG